MSKIELINDHFKLPIYYNEEKVELKETIINDLELINTIDPSGSSIYACALNINNDSLFSKNVANQITQLYTTDTSFLKESQQILKNYKPFAPNTDVKFSYTEIVKLWDEIKTDTGFKERYYYIDWPFWEFLNKSEQFLQFMSIYNIASPIFSLLVPIVILIVPFFIIKAKGLSLTLTEYIEILKVLASNNAIGKIFTQFNSVSVEQKMYLSISAGFYVFSIYQNILSCIRFNDNMKKIHDYLETVKNYLNHSIDSMNHFLTYTEPMESYTKFNKIVKKNIVILHDYRNKLVSISAYKLTLNKITEVGRILKCFYELYEDKEYNDAFMYSFGFNGYIECVEGLIQNIEQGKINFTKFTKKAKSTVFKKSYYATLMNSKPVKNTVKLKNNIIITGPNASGKTTILKSTLINIIISQQFGCGFYESATLCPYKYIHCYLNIPDTSGRDSLFQAEARRCKDIIDAINGSKKDRHFCAFDEIYSGTNPDEAVMSALAFMQYLITFKNVNCILTTHFIEVCKKLDSSGSIINCHMETKKSEDSFSYTYLMKPGISEVKGGIKILNDMNYPKEILSTFSTFSTFKKSGAKSNQI